MISEKHFVTILRRNCITDKCDAEKTLRGVYDQNSVIDCELLAYALDKIIHWVGTNVRSVFKSKSKISIFKKFLYFTKLV